MTCAVAVSLLRRVLMLVGMLPGVVLANVAQAQTWAERLGFPADKKVVILHAHDAGLCYESNAAVEQLAEQGVLQSASAMAPAPWFADCAEWARQHPEFDMGLQFTLNSELPQYRWRPLAPGEPVGSLIDASGFFWKSPRQTMVNGNLDDVLREMDAQYQAARLAGFTPSHLTTHMGTLFTRLEYAEAYLQFARRHWIPAVVVDLTPERLESFRSRGYPLPEELIRLIDDYPLPRVDDLKLLDSSSSFEEAQEKLLESITELAPGLTQIAVEPAVQSPALERLDDRWQLRAWDQQALSAPEFEQALDKAGVILTNWREVMTRYSGAP